MGLDPVSAIVSQVLNVVPSVFQAGVGLSQLGKANRIEKEYPRPEAEIAPSIKKLADYAYGQTLMQDLPGGDLYRSEIKGATAAGLKAASELGSGAEAYGMLGGLIGREQDAFASLARSTAEQVAGYKQNYMNILPMKAEEENRVWEWNKARPYMYAMDQAARLRDSGIKNIFSGGKNLFGSTAEAINPELNSSLLWGNSFGDKGVSDMTMEELVKFIKDNVLKDSDKPNDSGLGLPGNLVGHNSINPIS